MNTERALVLVDSRIMTPAFAAVPVFCSLATRAVMVASPENGWLTNHRLSFLPPMTEPPPVT
jgi:hypothetical protein